MHIIMIGVTLLVVGIVTFGISLLLPLYVYGSRKRNLPNTFESRQKYLIAKKKDRMLAWCYEGCEGLVRDQPGPGTGATAGAKGVEECVYTFDETGSNLLFRMPYFAPFKYFDQFICDLHIPYSAIVKIEHRKDEGAFQNVINLMTKRSGDNIEITIKESPIVLCIPTKFCPDFLCPESFTSSQD